VFLHSMLDTRCGQNTLHQYQPFRSDGIPFRFTLRFTEHDHHRSTRRRCPPYLQE
jgi:hypothetical protein